MSNPPSDLRQGKAAIFKGKGEPFSFSVQDLPDLKTGEVLVKVLYTTLCGSDIHTYTGRRIEPPHVVLGHEIVGEIVGLDYLHSGVDLRGDRIQIGDRIIWSLFSVPPGNLAPYPDIPQKSDNLFKYGHAPALAGDIFNGGLAEYCVLRNNTALLKITEEMPLEVAATISCAHSTMMGAIRVAGNIRGKKVMIFGAGLLGITCAAMCREAGAGFIGLMDNDTNRLTWGKLFGADQTYPADEISQVGKTWPAADLVFDVTGNPDVMKKGIESLQTGGVAVWIGAVFPEKPVEVDAQQIVRKILQIRGLHNYNYEDLLHAADFMENNYEKYPYSDLIEKEYNLDEIEAAFMYARDSKPVRVGIRIN